jgi:ribosomal subunit interface protein
MNINVFAKKTLVSRDVKKYAEEKLAKLDQVRNDIIGVDLTLELDHHKKEKTAATAKALVKIPGADLTAKAEARTLFAAIDELEGKLTKLALKDKDKKLARREKLKKSKAILRNLLGRGE